MPQLERWVTGTVLAERLGVHVGDVEGWSRVMPSSACLRTSATQCRFRESEVRAWLRTTEGQRATRQPTRVASEVPAWMTEKELARALRCTVTEVRRQVREGLPVDSSWAYMGYGPTFAATFLRDRPWMAGHGLLGRR